MIREVFGLIGRGGLRDPTLKKMDTRIINRALNA